MKQNHQDDSNVAHDAGNGIHFDESSLREAHSIPSSEMYINNGMRNKIESTYVMRLKKNSIHAFKHQIRLT